jgi:hypothetical protein
MSSKSISSVDGRNDVDGKSRKCPGDWWRAGTVEEGTNIPNNRLTCNQAGEMIGELNKIANQVSASILMHRSIPSPSLSGMEVSGFCSV